MNGLMLRGPRPGAAASAGQPAVAGPSAGLRRGSLAVARYAKSPVSDEMNNAVTAALSALLLFNSTAGPVPLAQAAPDTFVGTARVVDGDTLYIGSEKFRLYGVDAPETKQTCTDGVGQSYACGLVAKDALTQKIGNQPVSCKVRERDQYGRGVAVCSLAPGGVMGMVSGGAGAEELNSWLVKNGLAVAYSLPPGLPLPLPNQGIVLSAPSAASPAAIIPAPPLFCGPGVKPVKGNISGKGEKIYHLPGGAYYDKVLIEPEKGEQYFCTEQQAIAAGYRAAGTPQGGAAKAAPKPAAG
ncbi:high light-induced nuclease, partial [Haematococcus lacustris]